MIRFLILFPVAALLAGCAQHTPYVASLDQRVLRLEERTQEISSGKAGTRLSPSESQDYLRHGLATAQLVRSHLAQHQQEGPELASAENLQHRYETLLRRNATVSRAEARSLLPAVSEVLRYQASRRQVGQPRIFSNSATSSTTTDDDTATQDDRKKTDKKKKDERKKDCDDNDRRKRDRDDDHDKRR